MAVYSVSPVGQDPAAGPAPAVAAESSESFSSPNMIVNSPLSRPVNLSGLGDEPEDRKLNSYLLRHYQVAGSKAGKGFVSFVPIVVARPAIIRRQVDVATATGPELTDTESGQSQNR